MSEEYKQKLDELAKRLTEIKQLAKIEEIKDLLYAINDIIDGVYFGTFKVHDANENCIIELYENGIYITSVKIPSNTPVNKIKEAILSKRDELFINILDVLLRRLKYADEIKAWDKIEELEKEIKQLRKRIEEEYDP